MRQMLLVARRDLAGYLNSFWGYAVIAALLLVEGLFFNGFALGNQPKYSSKVIEDFFYLTFGITTAASILLTMRLVAEERQTGTIVLIDASPVSSWQLVGGKYLSAMTVLVAMVAATAYMPALVFVNGKVSYGHIFAGYLGVVLVVGAVAAVGTFASAISRSQLVAGFTSVAITVSLVVMWLLAKVADPPIADIFSYLSLFERHFRGFMRGQINSEDVVFYLSIAFVFLMLASRFMAARRWR
ncbi:MAG: ABC transporter permease subunit [Deltaproteobacteria bacterium]|jgi:ABC-2 type transport system permease protein|nr:ABC transporter permease subunit [Nannocystaceae bacterium]